MKTATLVLTVFHLTAIAGAVIAAAVDIESIVVTSIPCSLLGLSVAIAGLWRRNGAVALLGLSTPAVSIAVFVWIVVNAWSPGDAQLPVSAALLGYEVFCMAIGAVGAFHEARGGNLAAGPWRVQFHLRSLLVLMLLVGVDLAVVRVALAQNAGALLGAAIGLGLASLMGTLLAIVLGNKQLHAARELPSPVELGP
jgi:hypothetical protein